jgi:hypothetical protein
MNKIINSPIVITVIVIVAAVVLKTQTKPQIASEIRGAYDEIIAIAEEAGSDAEKTEAIREFSEQIATQLKAGFSSGFSSGGDDESREEKFLRIKKNVSITEAREIQSEWNGRQTVLFKVENSSEFALTQLKVNLEFYRDGELIDVKNETLHEIKVLDTGESFTAKKDRNTPNSLSDEEKAAFAFDEVRAFITSFNVVD